VAATPAIQEFVRELPARVAFGQALVSRAGEGFELRHVADRDQPEGLELIPVRELRALAEKTSGGAFRPLRGAPNLRAGWRCPVANTEELEQALNHLYPGALADWYASRHDVEPVSYREFTERQTGMYRITTLLDDAAAERMIAACCAPGHCLKERRWGIRQPSPPGDEPFAIPCLEPCAILLEFARKTVRMSQENHCSISLSESELDTLLAALDQPAVDGPETREADFSDPRNSRRRELLKSRLREARQKLGASPEA